jgi:uncharacterized membrane protein SpoIIM required for sporulation
MSVYLFTLLTSELQWRPPAMQMIQIMLLTGVQALVMVAGAVVVSSQATSTRAANLLASFIIVPMAFVIQGESVIMFLAEDAFSSRGIGALWAIIVGMAMVAVLLLRVGAAIFNREELLGRSIDSINLRASVRSIWRHIRAVDSTGRPARNLREWYGKSIPYSLAKLRLAVYVSLFVFVAAMVLGFVMGFREDYRLELPPGVIGRGVGLNDAVQAMPLGRSSDPIGFLFSQNSRVLLVSTGLGAVTFGVVPLALNPITFAVLGYITGQLFLTGNDPGIVAAAILPHGIVEIPIILIATAAALRLGAVITKLPRGKTVGQAWIEALGETIKIAIGVVLPGLIIAAIIEAVVTTRILAWYLAG